MLLANREIQAPINRDALEVNSMNRIQKQVSDLLIR